MFVYVLELQKNKYYVGKTSNPQFRLNQHFDANGSVWTRKYPPIRVIEIYPDCDKFDEDKYTKQYMEMYGIENVRGGSYSSITLDDEEVFLLDKELMSANDKCFRCGRTGHFANRCFAARHINGDVLDCYVEEVVWCCQYCDKEFDTEKGAIMHENIHCKSKRKSGCRRCGRNSHLIDNCFARTHVDGSFL
tara:strand:+ start:67 stop:639 length:573 start_codon:yes stop_codon:yes gene_type:complete